MSTSCCSINLLFLLLSSGSLVDIIIRASGVVLGDLFCYNPLLSYCERWSTADVQFAYFGFRLLPPGTCLLGLIKRAKGVIRACPTEQVRSVISFRRALILHRIFYSSWLLIYCISSGAFVEGLTIFV